MNDMRKAFLLTLMLLALFLSAFPVNFSSSTALVENTTLYIEPAQTAGLNVGDTFQISVLVSNVVDLYGWQFKLTYRSDALNATSISEGSFLKKDGASTFFWNVKFTDNYNETHGLIIAACTRTRVETGVDGDGTLATIVFKVKAAVTTVLHLFETKLIDSASPFGHPIPHTTVDGEVHAGFHDVAVTDIEVTTARVYVGQVVEIHVLVKNNGEYAETFDVTTYYDADTIDTQLVDTLPSGSESTLIFLWDTTDVEPDIAYTISAEASVVPGETNLNNNILVDGTVMVRSYSISLIRITEVVPCNQSGYPATSFKAGTIAYFKVIVNNTSFESEIVLVTVNVYDSSDTTLGVVSFKGAMMPDVSTFILGLPILSTTPSGPARVYANAFTEWPYFGGVPYCPEVSATFEIMSP